jgi:hypothetical protein
VDRALGDEVSTREPDRQVAVGVGVEIEVAGLRRLAQLALLARGEEESVDDQESSTSY